MLVNQKRLTSRAIHYWESVPVRLNVPAAAKPIYNKNGQLAKKQHPGYQLGDTVYLKLRDNGYLNLYPFEMAGDGWEIITDAEEGVHFNFIH